MTEVLTPRDHDKICEYVDCSSIFVVSVKIAEWLLVSHLIMIHLVIFLTIDEAEIILIMRDCIIKLVLPILADVCRESRMAITTDYNFTLT